MFFDILIFFLKMRLPASLGKASVRPFRRVISVCRSVGGGVLSFDGINGTGAGFTPGAAERRSVGEIGGSRLLDAAGEGSHKKFSVRGDGTAGAVHHPIAPLSEKEISRRRGVAAVGHLPAYELSIKSVVTAAQINCAVDAGTVRGAVKVGASTEERIFTAAYVNAGFSVFIPDDGSQSRRGQDFL